MIISREKLKAAVEAWRALSQEDRELFIFSIDYLLELEETAKPAQAKRGRPKGSPNKKDLPKVATVEVPHVVTT